MNFLAHAVLSFENPDLMVGNFIADFVKGNDYLDYPAGVSRGILLHREIDHFTDSHHQVRASKRRLSDNFGHYSGVVVDMYYDHFLAANFFKFHHQALPDFTQLVYATMERNKQHLPPKASIILHHMSRGDWLLEYGKIKGIEHALSNLSRRTKFKSNMENAGKSLRSNYKHFHSDFMRFFPKVVTFSRNEIQQA